MDRSVRISAKALVIRNGRMLAVKLRDRDGVFYIMPGGGQNAGELLPATAEREVAEETGIAVKAQEAVFVIEGAEECRGLLRCGQRSFPTYRRRLRCRQRSCWWKRWRRQRLRERRAHRSQNR